MKKVVKEYLVELNGFFTNTNLNVLPLGSYDALISMDWLEKHRAKVDYYDKIMECINEKGELIKVQGKTQIVLIRRISSL